MMRPERQALLKFIQKPIPIQFFLFVWFQSETQIWEAFFKTRDRQPKNSSYIDNLLNISEGVNQYRFITLKIWAFIPTVELSNLN